jgi:hypothetical protein
MESGHGPGTRHTYADGYTFIETLHGPMVESKCHDCGARVYVVGETDRYNAWGLKEDVLIGEPQCSTCGRRKHGLPPY